MGERGRGEEMNTASVAFQGFGVVRLCASLAARL